MGFPWGGKDKGAEAADSKKGFSIKPEVPSPQEAAPSQASSVFEFGPTVQVGQDYLRGVCIGEDPDAIQACTWSVEPAQKTKEKHHLYRIEF